VCQYKKLYGHHPQRATQGAIFGQPGTTLEELNRIPPGLVRSLFKQIERNRGTEHLKALGRASSVATAVTHECSEPGPIGLLNLVQARIEQLEAFDECEHQSSAPAVPLTEESPQSLFKAAGTSKPRLLTFRLMLKQTSNRGNGYARLGFVLHNYITTDDKEV